MHFDGTYTWAVQMWSTMSRISRRISTSPLRFRTMTCPRRSLSVPGRGRSHRLLLATNRSDSSKCLGKDHKLIIHRTPLESNNKLGRHWAGKGPQPSSSQPTSTTLKQIDCCHLQRRGWLIISIGKRLYRCRHWRQSMHKSILIWKDRVSCCIRGVGQAHWGLESILNQ